MELPAISSSRWNPQSKPAAMLSPTSRSPIGRSPSMSPGKFHHETLGGGLMNNSSSTNLLNTVVKMARNEASKGSIKFGDRKASMSVAGTTMDMTNSDSKALLSATGVHIRRGTMRPNRNSNNTTLSIQDITGAGALQYGMNFYQTPTNEHLLKRIHNGSTSKKKLFTFAEEIQKKKKFIPGPGLNQQIYEWTKERGRNYCKFDKEARTAYPAAKIMADAKRKGPGPSPSSYAIEKYRDKKIHGNYKQKDPLISFAQEAQNKFGDIPLCKYDAIELDKIKKKPRYTNIDKKIERFKSMERTLAPSPSSYDVGKAVQKTQFNGSTQPQWGSTVKVSYFEMMANRRNNDGPATGKNHGRKDDINSFMKLTSSPLKAKRH